MPSNRYDKPVEQEYVSQYTPIPFDQLYQLGKAYNDRVDKTLKDIKDNIEKYRTFKSPSAIDTQRYYDRTLTPIRQLVDKAVANPDLISTPEFQLQTQQMLNNVPYAELSMLEQQRDNFLKRQELEQKLSSQGKWYGPWHNMNYSDYDTLGDSTHRGQGLLDSSALNLVPYQSINDLVDPYVNDVPDTFLGSDGMYDYVGKSPSRLRHQVEQNMSEILNTPAAQMHVRQMINAGLSPEDAKNQFINWAYRAAEERATRTRTANPYALATLNGSLSGKKKSGDDDDVDWTNRDDELRNDRDKKIYDLSSAVAEVNNVKLKPEDLSKMSKEQLTARLNSPAQASDLDDSTPELYKLAYDQYAQNGASVYTATTAARSAQQMFNAMMKVFDRQQEFDPDSEESLIKQLSNAIVKQGSKKDEDGTTRVHTGSKYFNIVNKLYETGVDAMMVDDSAYATEDLNLLFGADAQDRTLAGLNVFTPKQFVLSNWPIIGEYLRQEGLSTSDVQADAPKYALFTADRNQDLEKIISQDSGNARPIKVNKLMINQDGSGNEQLIAKVTVEYPVDKLQNAPGLFVTQPGTLKDAGYSVVKKDGEDYVRTDVLVAFDYNDQLYRRFVQESEQIAGSTASRKGVRAMRSTDQNLVGKTHRIDGQH